MSRDPTATDLSTDIWHQQCTARLHGQGRAANLRVSARAAADSIIPGPWLLAV